jgi:hypothetical protein
MITADKSRSDPFVTAMFILVLGHLGKKHRLYRSSFDRLTVANTLPPLKKKHAECIRQLIFVYFVFLYLHRRGYPCVKPQKGKTGVLEGVLLLDSRQRLKQHRPFKDCPLKVV